MRAAARLSGAAADHCRAGPGQRPPADPLAHRLEKPVWLLLQLVDLALRPCNIVSLNPSSQKPKEMLFVKKPDSNNGKYTKAGLPKRQRGKVQPSCRSW